MAGPGLPARHPAWLLATWFGVGRLPLAPGTWGSLAALPFAWVLLWWRGPWALLAAAAILAVAGWWAASVYVARSRQHDPAPVVIDEVAGQWLALVPAAAERWWHVALGFLLFRVFDIVKPWPASWADRRLGGGLGVMLDDVIAGVYAGLVLLATIAIVEGHHFL